MYALYDSFNDRIISRHRTIAAAVRANRKLQNAFTGGSYLPTRIKRITGGNLIDLTEAEQDEVDVEQMSGDQ